LYQAGGDANCGGPHTDTASNEKLALIRELPPFFDLLAEVLHAESNDMGNADWRRRSFYVFKGFT
jgi:hypothetical protein